MKIQDVELTEEHKGKFVTYKTTDESGVISSWNEEYVFVKYVGRYGLQETSKGKSNGIEYSSPKENKGRIQ